MSVSVAMGRRHGSIMASFRGSWVYLEATIECRQLYQGVAPNYNSRMKTRCIAAILVAIVGCCVRNDFVDSAYGQMSFREQFVTAYCLDCHGKEASEADFSLENIGQDAAADVWHRVFQKLSNGTMPPDDELQPSDEERERLLAWVAKRFGTPPKLAATKHWSFQPLANSPQQDSKTTKSAVGSPSIDSFVEATLQQHHLKMSPATDRATLLRRVTLDLTGLPPTPDAVDAFQTDPAPFDDAYGKVVSQLLRSPRYGERWAQHWLDVIRWAETVGFETNSQRPHAWHYRDWVIDAFNEDMPYDQFVFEQLAGDTTGNDAALGFLVAGPANLPGQIGRDEEAMRQARQDALDETIRTVSQAFFGLTIGCARCHDHKFDPVTQADYYSMQAIFSGLRYGNRRLRGDENDAWTARLPHVQQKLAKLQKDLSEFRDRHKLRHAVDTVTSERFPVRLASSVRMEISATNGGPASLYEFEVFAGQRPQD